MFGGPELRSGDLVYCLGFDFAEVISFGCCINKARKAGSRRRRGGRNGDRVHIQYFDGTVFHARRCELHLLDTAGIGARLSECGICNDLGVVLNFSCNHSACLGCWIRWTNAQVESSLYCGHPSTVHCWGETCRVEINNVFWDLLPGILSSALAQQWPMEALRLLLNRRRLQSNVLLPQAMQVDCCRPDCIGLGYLGFDTVQCFICDHQWIPQDSRMIADGPDDEMSGVKGCPNCHVWILKNGGCDHMTCIMCRHEFWWTTLQPYP